MTRHTPKLSVKIIDFKPWGRGSLRGFLDILIPEIRLRISDVTAHQAYGKRWVNLPARPQFTSDGAVRRDKSGRVIYSNILQFTDRAASDAFSARTIAAPLERFPEAFSDGGQHDSA